MDWHARYVQQARWTQDLREYLFRSADMYNAHRIVEIGCGTGAILGETKTKAISYGVDINIHHLASAQKHAPNARLVAADAFHLPFQNPTFDITYSHFLLLWVKDPLKVLLEMKRITRPGGIVLAFAEPDYSTRIDEPDELSRLGQWQCESLRKQGADPGLGCRLAGLFHQAGLKVLETGFIAESKTAYPTEQDRNSEWEVIVHDLAGFVSPNEIHRLERIDKQAWLAGTRRLFIPTYYASGLV